MSHRSSANRGWVFSGGWLEHWLDTGFVCCFGLKLFCYWVNNLIIFNDSSYLSR